MQPLLIILGPTAVGKTGHSLRLAEEIGAEIISVDSMQVYRGLDIGTAKPSPEEQARVRHHLIDVVEPYEDFSAGDFVRLADVAIADIRARGKVPLIVGGTGLYIGALVNGIFEGPTKDPDYRDELIGRERRTPGTLHAELAGIDPAAAARIHVSDVRRIIRALEVYRAEGRPITEVHRDHRAQSEPRPANIVGLTRPRPELYERIERRVDEMMWAGFLREVRGLRDAGVSRESTAMQALGYKQLYAHLEGEVDIEETVRLIKRDTRRYAKRQYSWFNNMDGVNWVEMDDNNILETVGSIKKALDIFG
jgi:tRNA dimethylallyltransferase